MASPRRGFSSEDVVLMLKRLPSFLEQRNKMGCENGGPCEFPKDSLVKPAFRHLSAAANLAFNEKVNTMIQSGRNVAHFGFGQSPFPVPKTLQEELGKFVHVNGYLPVKGIPELRKAIAEFHLHFDDLKLDPEFLIVAPGSKDLIFMLMKLFDGVIFLTSPSWTTYEPQAILSGNIPVILSTDKARGWKVTPESILAGVEHLTSYSRKGIKLLVLNTPGNPTGTCYTEKELRDLSDCCRQNKIIILSDEIYARLSFNKKHVSIAKFYPEGTILTSGLSKWASAGGWRLGYAYIPPTLSSLYDALMSYASNSYSCAPAPMQYAAANAITYHLSELEEYMDDCSAILKIVGDFCHRELDSVGVTGKQSEAGYYFMPDFEVIRNGLRKRGIHTGMQMTKAILEEADVALMAGEAFLRPSQELCVRFCFVCFDGEQALKVYREKKKAGLVLPQARKEEKERFLRENCKNVVDGIQRLKEWVLENKS